LKILIDAVTALLYVKLAFSKQIIALLAMMEHFSIKLVSPAQAAHFHANIVKIEKNAYHAKMGLYSIKKGA